MEVLEGQDGELDAMKDEMLLESDQHDMASDDDMGRRALVEALRLNAFRSGALSFPDDSLPQTWVIKPESLMGTTNRRNWL